MLIVRNEAHRYLKECLDHLDRYVDKMLIIDDASTDHTPEICESYDKAVVIKLENSMFENEVELRKLAWKHAADLNPEWILAIDADEIFEDAIIDSIPGMLESDEYQAYAFRLYDFWGCKDKYREDASWQAHHYYKTFLVKYTADNPEWINAPKHCGRFPINYTTNLKTYYSDIRVKHYGWADPVDILRKYDYYMKEDGDGKYGSLQQYRSILDENPNLIQWKESLGENAKILIGSVVHKDPVVLAEFINSLLKLDTNNLNVSYLFIDDNTDNVSSGLLELFSRKKKNVEIIKIPQDETRKEKDSLDEEWNWNKEFRVAELKNMIINKAKRDEFDYLLLIDADILLYTRSLKHLIACDKPIISEIIWDARNKEPQVWFYDEKLRYWIGNYEKPSEQEIKARKEHMIETLSLPGTIQVGGVGACTFLRKDALNYPIHFHRIPNLSFNSEDVHFSVRASALGIPLYVDTILPAFHIYNYSEQKELINDYKREAGIISKIDTEAVIEQS